MEQSIHVEATAGILAAGLDNAMLSLWAIMTLKVFVYAPVCFLSRALITGQHALQLSLFWTLRPLASTRA